MMLWIVLLVLLLLALGGTYPPLGLVPNSMGYWPSGLVVILLLVILIAFLAQRL
jgi:hypothetical protein